MQSCSLHHVVCPPSWFQEKSVNVLSSHVLTILAFYGPIKGRAHTISLFLYQAIFLQWDLSLVYQEITESHLWMTYP